MSKPTLPTLSKRRLSRRQKHFKIPPKISFDEEYESPFTRLFLVTADRPGLLAEISRIFSSHRIHLHNAKISTAGERVEDMFYISGQTGLPLSLEEKEALKEQLIKKLT